MIQHYWQLLDNDKPMASARLVRREKYAWPGGYQLALVMDDGALLCPECVAAEYHQIGRAHQTQARNGWRPVGKTILCNGESETAEYCAHCDRELASAADNRALPKRRE